jgi:ABC-type nitrate/sulfonate/bicarbonate transport system permease component
VVTIQSSTEAASSEAASTNPFANVPIQVWHFLFAVLVFGGWEVTARLIDNAILFPTLSDVAAAFWDITTSGKLIVALGGSLRLLFSGFAIAFAFGLVVGVAAGYNRAIGMAFIPLISFIYSVPIIAMLPLILMWFGFGYTGRLIVVAYSSFFPVLLNTYAGVRETPADLMEVARSFGLTGHLQLLRRVVIPSSVPFIMAGFRLGVGRAVVGMALAEVFLRLGGIGALIVEYGARFATAYVVASILPLPVLGIGLTKAAEVVERRLQYWRTVPV